MFMTADVFYSHVCLCEEGVVVMLGNFLSIRLTEFSRCGAGMCMASFI